MTAEVRTLHRATRDPDAIMAERKQHADGLRQCDAELFAAFERQAHDLERTCRAIIETDLHIGIREEARQLADDLGDRVQRVMKLRSTP